MFTDQSTDISLGASCRALDAVRADKEHNFWIAGTCGGGSGSSTSRHSRHRPPASVNQSGSTTHGSSSTLQILQFHNDINEIVITASYDIDGPGVRKVSSCPYDKELVLVASEQRSSVILYRLPPYGDTGTINDSDNYEVDQSPVTTTRRDYAQNDTVEVVATLTPEGGFGANIADVAWRYDTSSSSSFDPTMDGTNNSGVSTNSSSILTPNVGDVVTVDTNGHLSLWDMNTHQQVLSFDTSENPDAYQNKGIPQPKVLWDPHTNGNTMAVTVPAQNQKHINMVSIFDVRCTKENWDHNPGTGTTMPSPPSSVMQIGGQYPPHYGIMDIDYNPNRPFMMGMACRNGTCQFYDVRLLTHPVTHTTQQPVPVCVARGGHSHYCTSIRYNPFHDQLVVSTGADHMSHLWRLSSCSSAPVLLPTTSLAHATTNTFLNDDDDDVDDYHTNTMSPMATTNSVTNDDHHHTATNVCVQRYEYSDAVYTTAWGANDAWIYLTISYQDGKAVLQHVPSTEKYKILL